MDHPKRRKLILIGVDAADSDLVHKWADQGYLPTLAKLRAGGLVMPIATPPAVLEGAIWPTLTTGTSPASHGLFSYWQIKPGSYELRLGTDVARLAFSPFWVYLSGAGKRIAVIDVPFTKPCRGLNGVHVVNWGAHDSWSWKRSSWPPRFVKQLVKQFGVHPVSHCDADNRTLRDYELLRRCLIAGVHRKAALLRFCLNLEDWDFFFGVFSESHCVGHQCWHLMDSSHPRHDPQASGTLQTAIRDVYQAIDISLAELLEATGPDSNFLVFLSHGMGPYYAGSHLLYDVLKRLDVNGPAANLPPSKGALLSFKESVWGCGRVLPTAFRNGLKGLLPAAFLHTLWRWTHTEAAWQSNLRAFPVPSNNMTGGIRINLKGREPAGIVDPGTEYDALCKHLTEVLLSLENAETGIRAVQWVKRAQDLYQGPCLGEFPDLFVEWDHRAPIRELHSPFLGTITGEFMEARTGDHWPNGLLFATGPAFRQGVVQEEMRTMDLAPTILDLFGIAAPQTFQGQSKLRFLINDDPPSEQAVWQRTRLSLSSSCSS